MTDTSDAYTYPIIDFHAGIRRLASRRATEATATALCPLGRTTSAAAARRLGCHWRLGRRLDGGLSRRLLAVATKYRGTRNNVVRQGAIDINMNPRIRT